MLILDSQISIRAHINTGVNIDVMLALLCIHAIFNIFSTTKTAPSTKSRCFTFILKCCCGKTRTKHGSTCLMLVLEGGMLVSISIYMYT